MERVMLRLRALGYETEDTEGVSQALDFAREELTARANLEEIPRAMEGMLTEFAAHKYLLLHGVREVRLGDLTLKLEGEAPDVARFRKVVW